MIHLKKTGLDCFKDRSLPKVKCSLGERVLFYSFLKFVIIVLQETIAGISEIIEIFFKKRKGPARGLGLRFTRAPHPVAERLGISCFPSGCFTPMRTSSERAGSRGGYSFLFDEKSFDIKNLIFKVAGFLQIFESFIPVGFEKFQTFRFGFFLH